MKFAVENEKQNLPRARAQLQMRDGQERAPKQSLNSGTH